MNAAASAVQPRKQQALALAEEYGIPVFPCDHTPVLKEGLWTADKSPLGACVPQGFKDATCNTDLIEDWWTRYPRALIGVPTGAASKIFVIDVDPAGEGYYSENPGLFEAGRIHKTNRGFHLLYRHPGDLGTTAKKWHPGKGRCKTDTGFDTRGDGGYIIWWPAEGLNSIGDVEDIGPVPELLLTSLRQYQATRNTNRERDPNGGVGEDRSADLLKRVGKDVRSGKADYEILRDHIGHPHAASQADPGRAVQRAIDKARGDSGPRAVPANGASQEIQSAQELWKLYGLDAGKGAPYATADNVERVLSRSPEFSTDVIWYDSFRERVLTTWQVPQGRSSREWSDDDDAYLLVHFQRTLSWHNLNQTALQSGLTAFLKKHRRNPLTEYLSSLQWDGVERLPTFLADAYDAPQDAYHSAVGRCWLTSMVARAFRPGCQVDTMVVLEGAQGIKKSTSLEILGGEFYTSLPRGFGDVEFLQVMEGCWLGEIPDMASFRGRDLEHIKAFITIREDRYRRSYGRRAITRQRQTVFAATDNSGDWNGDVTGARRFWPFICKTVNIDYLKTNRDQLFAEAVVRLNRGESWWDVPMVDQIEQADRRRFGDAWEELIERYVNEIPKRDHGETFWVPRPEQLPELRVNDILQHALDIPPGRWDRGSQTRVAKCLQALGWRRSKRRDGESRYWAYVKPVGP